jgi:hypothetical protein
MHDGYVTCSFLSPSSQSCRILSTLVNDSRWVCQCQFLIESQFTTWNAVRGWFGGGGAKGRTGGVSDVKNVRSRYPSEASTEYRFKSVVYVCVSRCCQAKVTLPVTVSCVMAYLFVVTVCGILT